MSSNLLELHENREIPRANSKHKEYNKSLFGYKYRLAMHSSINYLNGTGYICPYINLAEVQFMLSKKIKLLAYNQCRETILVTEDGETYSFNRTFPNQPWSSLHNLLENDTQKISTKPRIYYYSHMFDLSNTRIVKIAINKNNFLALTDDGKIYSYADVEKHLSIREINVKEKIIHIACGHDFYVVVTNKGKIYNWGYNYNGQLGLSNIKMYTKMPREVIRLSNSRIVKVGCGLTHTLALTDEGKVYFWGEDMFREKDHYYTYSIPILVNSRINIQKISDIGTINDVSAVKSSEDGMAYIWGSFHAICAKINTYIICEYTNIFDVSNSMMAQSPASMNHEFTDEESSILNDLADSFNDRTTSDLTVEVENRFIYVHKAILKIRSSYFRTMFQCNWIENNQNIIKHRYYSYVVYKTFLKYLYTGTINLLSVESKLSLLTLAVEYFEENLKKDCIRMIKKEITVSNIHFIYEIAIKHKIEILEGPCLNFIGKYETDIERMGSYRQIDEDKRQIFRIKILEFMLTGRMWKDV